MLNRYVINIPVAFKLIEAIYERKGWVWPDGQDAASFTVSEAAEMLDCILRRKTYVRNHNKPVDTLGREAAQCLLMLLVTCQLEGINLDHEFRKLVEEG